MYSTNKPLLVPDLRLALATLYSLPLPPSLDPRTKPSSKQAHDYLLNFQTRNVRRKLKDSQPDNNQKQQIDSTDAGSSWLACIYLISSIANTNHDPNNHNNQKVQYAESLFAAQTLVHRLRRVKLCEAIDIEFEDHSSSTLPLRPEQVLEGYRRWIMQHYQGSSNSSFEILSQLVNNYHPAVDPQQQTNVVEYEERIKGEISMMLLASILDALTKSCYQQQHQHTNIQQQQQQQQHMFAHIRPLLKTLASAIAVISARMRYTSTSLPDPAPHTQPMVTTILGTIIMLQSQTQHQNQNQNQEAVHSLYYTVLTALPEAILAGSGGGAYGRLSLDPRCFFAVTNELKTQGMIQVWQSLRDLITSTSTATIHSTSSVLLLQMCEAWAKYVPLPIEFVNSSVSLVLRAWDQPSSLDQPQSQKSLEAKAAMAYWIAIMESGTWTIDQVLASSIVQSKEGSRQTNKKKQSSKSKKRTQQRIEEKSTDELLISARNEVRHRGETACTMAQQTWSRLEELLRLELRRIVEDSNSESLDEQDVQGDGPVGAIAACANACLPFILREPGVHQDTTSMSLFVSISHSIQQVCASPSRMVRSFTAESLYTLHDVLSKILTTDSNPSLTADLFEVITFHFFQSSMNLASQCGYPSGYFNDLGEDNDEDLESERNDVREVLRTMSCFPSTTSIRSENYPASLIAVSSSILLRLLQCCALPIQEAATTNTLFPETALHAFSALAKPINSVASLYLEYLNQGAPEDKNFIVILNLAFEIIKTAGRCLLLVFPIASVKEILPLSRVYNLAVASLSPLLSKLTQIPTMEPEVKTIMRIGIEAAATSMLRLPELTGPSSLRSSRFDIRGAMRSPGGEDHVGVLALMRLAYESDSLSLVFLRSKESILVDLCGLYEELKKIENQRGGLLYGIGVFPKSRRILLGVICHLEIISGGTAKASGVLTAIFENAIGSIAGTSIEHLQAEHLYRVCESTFDIAAFSSNVIQSFFTISDSANLQATCLRVLHLAGNFGFVSVGDTSIPYENIIQWNRLRAALFTLLRISGNPDLPASTVEMLVSLITTECGAVIAQCSAGPTSSSIIFHEDVISEETGIPAGIGIRAVLETLEKACSLKTPIFSMRNCLHVLYTSRQVVFRTLLSECPMPVEKGSFHDPRPVIAETWFLCMNQIAIVIGKSHEDNGAEVATVIKQLLVETFNVAISLLFYSSLEKTQDKRALDPGMSLDGPHGLVMMEFFISYFNLGSVMIQSAAKELLIAIPVATSHDPDADGLGIIGAALFRGSQGGLPPWAIESLPSVYSSLFNALNKNVNTFGLMFEMSMNIRLQEDRRFGRVVGGSLLSGKFFERMNDEAKRNFVDQAKEWASTDTIASWRSLKTLIKKACGGKKKDTDFNQRPALTSWDSLDRI